MNKLTLLRAAIPSSLADASLQHLVTDRSGFIYADIELVKGKVAMIKAIDTNRVATTPEVIDLDYGQVWPCYVDVHTHLDKSFIADRTKNRQGDLLGAIEAEKADQSKFWSQEDLYQRMDFALQCAYAHGTAAVRTHLISNENLRDVVWQVFSQIKDQWSEKISLQPVSIVSSDDMVAEKGAQLADFVAQRGGVLGCAFIGAKHQSECADILDHILLLAKERELDLDFHADENGDANSHWLRCIAQAALRNNFDRKIVVGHCCSLSKQSQQEVSKTLSLVADANISIVGLPTTNMYLQDRQPDASPSWRGFTKAHEIVDAGIDISFASDNCRDLFNIFGDYDMHEIFRQAVLVGQLDLSIDQWPAALTTNPAQIMGLNDKGIIGVGHWADLILFSARSYGELLSRPQHDRIVLRQGRQIDTKLPDYRDIL